MIKINIMKKGDSVAYVSQNMVAIKRKNGEVDLFSISFDDGLLRIDEQSSITIGYGDNTTTTILDGENGEVSITTF